MRFHAINVFVSLSLIHAKMASNSNNQTFQNATKLQQIQFLQICSCQIIAFLCHKCFCLFDVFAMPKCMLYELLYRKIKSNYWFKIKMRKVFEY